MVESKIRQLLFEESSQWLQLSKPEDTSKEEVIRLLGIKPGEFNIILARVSEFLQEKTPGKTKRDVIIEILEVLNRSFIARNLVGMGLKDNYTIFKGFVVRRGDEHDDLPQPDSEILLTPKDTFISWTTQATQARESGATWDSTKGDPIGGLVVSSTVDYSKVLFDINAVSNFVKEHYESIMEYNNQAKPGWAISKTNVEYLAKKAQYYTGDYEVITPTTIKNVMVTDKWISDETNNIDWKTSDKKNVSGGSNEVDNEESEESSPIKEMLSLFESHDIVFKESNIYELEEGIMDFFSKIAGTVRGKTLKYLESLNEQHKKQLEMLENAKNFAKMVDDDDERVDLINNEMQEARNLLRKVSSLYTQIKSNRKLGLKFT